MTPTRDRQLGQLPRAFHVALRRLGNLARYREQAQLRVAGWAAVCSGSALGATDHCLLHWPLAPPIKASGPSGP